MEGATIARIFETYVERVLAPSLRRGQLAIMYSCKLLYLPPYSPDLNPIEEAFSKIKGRPKLAPVRPWSR